MNAHFLFSFQSDIIYTFFHSILRDQKEDLCDIEMISIINDETANSEETRNRNFMINFLTITNKLI